MTDLLAEGAQFLTDTRTAHMSKEVTFAPQLGAPVTVVAAIGSTRFQVTTDQPNSYQEVESRDFIVAAGALATDPAKGDLIKEPVGDGTRVRVHAVSCPGDGPVFKPDAHRTCIRIHTKYLRTEDA